MQADYNPVKTSDEQLSETQLDKDVDIGHREKHPKN